MYLGLMFFMAIRPVPGRASSSRSEQRRPQNHTRITMPKSTWCGTEIRLKERRGYLVAAESRRTKEEPVAYLCRSQRGGHRRGKREAFE
jgi:hypothetical protein